MSPMKTISVWAGSTKGYEAECDCGWETGFNPDPDIILEAAEDHAEQTGHDWPTRAIL